MTFTDLHELLRLELVRRIDAGQLTGTRLAQQTGFRQAHISNFLNRKRALSLEGLDRVLEAQRLTIDQILPIQLDSPGGDARLIRHRGHLSSRSSDQQRTRSSSSSLTQRQFTATDRDSASVPSLSASVPEPVFPTESDDVVHVPLVSPSVAMLHPRIAPAAILESIPVAAQHLPSGNPRIASMRQLWQRFIAIRADAQQAAAMAPVLTPGAAAVLDRHATSPVTTSRSADPALFAVRSGTSLLLRLVEIDDDHLILRPLSRDTPVQLIPISQENPPSDYLIGRVLLLLTTL